MGQLLKILEALKWPIWAVLLVVFIIYGPKWVKAISDCVIEHRKLDAKFEKDRIKRENAFAARKEKEARKAKATQSPQHNTKKKR